MVLYIIAQGGKGGGWLMLEFINDTVEDVIDKNRWPRLDSNQRHTVL